jgi:nucleoside-diphosphate-sugar epimerase
MIRVLILGGTRFFGLELVHRLSERGYDVTVLTRGRTSAELPPSVEHLRGDRRDEASLRAAIGSRTWDIVVDNIGFTGPESDIALRVFEGRTGRFLFTSTAAVYYCLKDLVCPFKETDTETFPLREEARTDPRMSYGYGKLQAERVLLTAYRDRGFPVTILRLPIVIGPRDFTLRAYSYWIRIKDGAPLILPDGGRLAWRFISSGDVVRAFFAVMENDRSVGQVYNVAQEEIVSLREWVKLSAKILDRPVELINIPSEWLSAQGITPDFSPYTVARSWILDIAKAQRELGWASTPWREWMEATIGWYERAYHGPPPENYFRRGDELALIDRWRRMTA